MSLSSLPAWPIDEGLPPELAFLANDISTYFDANPPYSKASLAALIFTPPPEPPTLLLIQGPHTADPAFSSFWRAPNGYPTPSDSTMLHTLSRIILDQTGLHLSRVLTMSGSEVGPGTVESGTAEWMRLQFTVLVSELRSDSDQILQPSPVSPVGNHGYSLHGNRGNAKEAVSKMLNSEKRQRHAWVTEKDLKEFIQSGLFPIDELKQYQSMLDAFSLYRQDIAQIQSGPLQSPTPSHAPSSGSDSAPTFSASEDPTSTRVMSPKKVHKKTPKKRTSKAEKTGADASHFHRFRLS